MLYEVITAAHCFGHTGLGAGTRRHRTDRAYRDVPATAVDQPDGDGAHRDLALLPAAAR